MGKILQLSADHYAGWPLCKLWELRFSIPDLVSSTPPPPPLPWYETIRRLANNGACNCIFSYWVRRVLPFSVFCFGVKHSTEMPVESSIYLYSLLQVYALSRKKTNNCACTRAFQCKMTIKIVVCEWIKIDNSSTFAPGLSFRLRPWLWRYVVRVNRAIIVIIVRKAVRTWAFKHFVRRKFEIAEKAEMAVQDERLVAIPLNEDSFTSLVTSL